MTAVNQFYKEASYQQYSISADVYGPLSLPINAPCVTGSDTSTFSAVTNAGILAAETSGIDLSPYQSYAFIVPENLQQCVNGILGVATIGGTPGLVAVFASEYATSEVTGKPVLSATTAHEIGHNLGLYHSHAYACTTAIYNPNVNCGLLEYGDEFDTMGAAPSLASESPHFNASDKNILGWLSPQIVSSTGAYAITPYEVTGAGTKSLEIELPFPLNSDAFYIEFRQPIGFDSYFAAFGAGATQAYNGPLIHLAGNPDFILNMDPQNTTVCCPPTPALVPSEKYTDYANRFSVTTVSVSPASAQVRVLIPSLSAPTAMFVSPSNGAVLGGITTVTADALDLTAVVKVNLYCDGTLIGTQTGSVGQAGAVVVNQNYTFPWDTTTATAGAHELTFTAYNAAGGSYSTSISVLVHKPPMISLIAPTNGLLALVGSSVVLSAQAASPESGVSIAQVEFFANGVSLGLGTAAGSGVYNLNWTPTAAGSYSISATATDSNGVTATTAAATVTSVLPVIASVNVVSGGTTISENAWIEIHGSNLAPASVPSGGLTWSGAASFSQGEMPTLLDGVSMKVNGVPAYVYFISQSQIDVLMPLVALASNSVVVTIGTASSSPFRVNGNSLSPAFALASGGKYLTATHANGTYVGATTPDGLFSPAAPGEEIVLYGFGFGLPSSGSLVAGSSTQTGTLPSLPAVQIGGQAAQVVFAGLISPGLYQFNVVVPPIASNGDNAVTAVYNGFSISTVGFVPVQGS
jgi:uncharacterized protein (TIGR03437 family)